MNPLALVALGAAGFVVWYSTQPGVGGLGALLSGKSGNRITEDMIPRLDEQQRAALTSGFAVHLSTQQAAMAGASAGAPLAVATFGIAPAVGALIGWLSVRNSNDTKEDREVFAQRLGFTGANGDGLGIHSQPTVSYDDKTKGLYSYLIFIGRGDLTETAMHVIGRKDFVGNERWFYDVVDALERIRFPFPSTF